MRIALLSDIHAQPWALEAVIHHAKARGVDAFWCLGDLIGYGPDACAALDLANAWFDRDNWIIGNHEQTLLELLNYRERPDQAQALGNQSGAPQTLRQMVNCQDTNGLSEIANRLHGEQIYDARQPEIESLLVHWCQLRDTASGTDFLQFIRRAEVAPPRQAKFKNWQPEMNVLLTHATLSRPLYDYNWPWQDGWFCYATNLAPDVRGDLLTLPPDTPVCLCHGHTHIPAFWTFQNGVDQWPVEKDFRYGEKLPLLGDVTIISPGSVGHPRDLDPRAAYAILDCEQRHVTFYRVDWRENGGRRAFIKSCNTAFSMTLAQQMIGEVLQGLLGKDDVPEAYMECLMKRAGEPGD